MIFKDHLIDSGSHLLVVLRVLYLNLCSLQAQIGNDASTHICWVSDTLMHTSCVDLPPTSPPKLLLLTLSLIFFSSVPHMLHHTPSAVAWVYCTHLLNLQIQIWYKCYSCKVTHWIGYHISSDFARRWHCWVVSRAGTAWQWGDDSQPLWLHLFRCWCTDFLTEKKKKKLLSVICIRNSWWQYNWAVQVITL